MAFLIDKQTLDDLNIFGHRGQNSIYQMFCTTRTRGGAQLLEEMFRYPLDDYIKINQRSDTIRSLMNHLQEFPFQGEIIDTVDNYLQNSDIRTQLCVEDNTLQRKLKGVIGADTAFEDIHKGVLACVALMENVQHFVYDWDARNSCNIQEKLQTIKALIATSDFDLLRNVYGQKRLTYETCAQLDKLLRFVIREKLIRLLHFVYYIDVCLAVADTASKRGFCFAEALSAGEKEVLQIKEMYHPSIPNAISNSLNITQENNVLFLTGANMAGKSTFMKTIGTVMFLAHMGFPIPATSMRFSVLGGMFTTINLPDNLNMGYSHYYAEVLRVKKVATQLSEQKRIMVIFDELFRGTNVKDAYDATVAITQAFACHKKCLFVISTHITEAGEDLREICSNVNFVYMPTVLDGAIPRYTYKLTQGITEDRHGMLIIQKEGILAMLNDNKKFFLNNEHKNGAFEEKVPSFITDKQTLEDLNILGEFRVNSIFSLFNKTRTSGGKQLLENMFKQPLTDATSINERAEIFSYFQKTTLQFPINEAIFRIVDDYFSNGSSDSCFGTFLNITHKRILSYISSNKEYEMIVDGVKSSVILLQQLQDFIRLVKDGNVIVPKKLLREMEPIESFLKRKELSWALNRNETCDFCLNIGYRDFVLRVSLFEEMRQIILFIYAIDVYTSVAAIATEKGLHCARALPFVERENYISIKGLRHPALLHAVTNDITLQYEQNILFLTGANMAGKSTLMKSFSIAVYLAHVGLPVAATEMEFSVQDGLYTSINVADNLDAGYSHYYAEVLRVKHVAKEIASGKHLLVLFDELFKGTNVKDAHEATVAVTKAIAFHRSCSFIISTHIIEAGHDLRDAISNIHFVYVPTELDEKGYPHYLYCLREGITDDRHGMLIIQREKILELLAGD